MDTATAISCLAAGADELAALLGHGEYHQPLDRSELVDRWVTKVVGAGLDESDARAFLELRLAGDNPAIWSFRVGGLGYHDPDELLGTRNELVGYLRKIGCQPVSIDGEKVEMIGGIRMASELIIDVFASNSGIVVDCSFPEDAE